MCGIVVSIGFTGSSSSIHEKLAPWISSRGPDSLKTVKFNLASTHAGSPELTFTSSVLHLRGAEVAVQPLVSTTGDILCWNGEVWKGLEIGENENDGLKLLDALSSISERKKVWQIMEKVEGPWAMAYFSTRENKLYFGRDCLGRRSLLRGVGEDGAFLLSSVGVGSYGWEEVSVDGLWCIDLDEWSEECGIDMKCPAKLYPWITDCDDPTSVKTNDYMVWFFMILLTICFGLIRP